MALTKNQILEADDLPREEITVSEWGGTVWIQTLTGTQRDDFEQTMLASREEKRKLSNVRARLCALCIVDADGERLFENADVQALGHKSGTVLDRIFEACRKLNGFSDADVKELEGNSGDTPSDDSSSG